MEFSWNIGAVEILLDWLMDWLDDVVGLTCIR